MPIWRHGDISQNVHAESGDGTKRQPEGTFIHNVGEQADHSVTFSSYAEHIQTVGSPHSKDGRKENQ